MWSASAPPSSPWRYRRERALHPRPGGAAEGEGGVSEAYSLAVEYIVVGKRRREDMGDLHGLAESIEKYGLLQPIVIDEALHLVAGERRLNACRMLGWSSVPVRNVGDLTEEERREIELEENDQRKALTDHERSRDLTTRAQSTAKAISSKLEEKQPQGRRSTYEAPKADIAKAIGSSVGSLVRAEQHVETTDAYPFMQAPDWKQYHVLEARTHLEAIPETERPVLAAVVSSPGIPPKLANAMLANLRQMPDPERAEVVRLAQSDDPRERSLAETKAAAQPPNPDPRVLMVGAALKELNGCIKGHEQSPLTPRFQAVIDELKTLQSLSRGEANGSNG